MLNQFEVPAESVGFFIHGTTVATNTILERKGAEVALLVTAGFRDVPLHHAAGPAPASTTTSSSVPSP